MSHTRARPWHSRAEQLNKRWRAGEDILSRAAELGYSRAKTGSEHARRAKAWHEHVQATFRCQRWTKRVEQGQKCQRRAKAAQGQAEPRQVREMQRQVCSALGRTGQSRTWRIGEMQSQGRIGPDLGSSKQGSGQNRSRPRQTKSMAGKRHKRAKEAVIGEAKPGSGMAG